MALWNPDSRGPLGRRVAPQPDRGLLNGLTDEGEETLGVLVRLHRGDPVHTRPVFHRLGRLEAERDALS